MAFQTGCTILPRLLEACSCLKQHRRLVVGSPILIQATGMVRELDRPAAIRVEMLPSDVRVGDDVAPCPQRKGMLEQLGELERPPLQKTFGLGCRMVKWSGL